MSTKDLLNAIIAGDAVEIETAFNDTMAEKISIQVDAKRQEVAQSMFANATEEIEESCDSDSKKPRKDTKKVSDLGEDAA